MNAEEKKLTVEASLVNLDLVLAFVEKELEAASCPAKIQGQICVALEELYVNIANYAYEGQTGECIICLCISTDGNGKRLELILKDKGKPFNPLDKADPDISLSAEDRPIGGLGIFMVKKIMDEVSYSYQEGFNCLTLVKKWIVE